MKKFISFCLLTVCLSLCLSSCSGSSGILGNAPAQESSQTTESQKSVASVSSANSSSGITLVDVTGQTTDTAKAKLESAGFTVNVKEEESDTVKEGLVISQQPSVENNLKLKKGDAVTIIVSKGKPENKTVYLDAIPYADFKNENPKNNFSAFTGNDHKGNKCERAINYHIDTFQDDYSDDVQKSGTYSYKVYYKLDKKYTKFVSELMAGSYVNNTVNVKLYADDKMLYSMSVTNKTDPVPLEFDISDADMFCIEIGSLIDEHDNTSDVILNKPCFE